MVTRKSFWSSTSGVVTGAAGILTGVVGIVTAAAQLGWMGPAENDSQSMTKEAHAAGTSTTGAASDDRAGGDQRAARSAATASPRFALDPSSVSFQALGQRTSTVELRNTGGIALNVQGVSVDGGDRSSFAVAAGPCTQGSVAPGRSCEMEVSFVPEGNGNAKATLVVEVEDAPAQEVPLVGGSIL